MSRRSRVFVALAAAVVVSLLSTTAAGESGPAEDAVSDATPAPVAEAPTPMFLHFRTPSTVTTTGGSTLSLPPGWFLDEPGFDTLDLEIRRLQDTETRLDAENRSLRDSARAPSIGGGRGFLLGVAIGLAAGVVTGYYAFR